MNAHVDGVFGQACLLSRFSDGNKIAIAPNESTGSSIARLRVYIRPSAICRLVIAVIIDAVKRCVGRALAHVRKKILKLPPALAHVNPTSAIISKTRMFRVGASLIHIDPNCILTRNCPLSRMPVRGEGFRNAVSLEASAAKSGSKAQFLGVDHFFGSACTTASPIRFPQVRATYLFDYDQSADGLT